MKIIKENIRIRYVIIWNGAKRLCDNIDDLQEALLAAKAFARKKRDNKEQGYLGLYAVQGDASVVLEFYRIEE